jgi:hypothetical protein
MLLIIPDFCLCKFGKAYRQVLPDNFELSKSDQFPVDAERDVIAHAPSRVQYRVPSHAKHVGDPEPGQGNVHGEFAREHLDLRPVIVRLDNWRRFRSCTCFWHDA